MKVKEEQISVDITKKDEVIDYNINITTVEKEISDKIEFLGDEFLSKDPILVEAHQKIKDRLFEMNKTLEPEKKYREWLSLIVRPDDNCLEVLEDGLDFIIRNAMLNLKSIKNTFQWLMDKLMFEEFKMRMQTSSVLTKVIFKEMANRKKIMEKENADRAHISYEELKNLMEKEIEQRFKDEMEDR